MKRNFSLIKASLLLLAASGISFGANATTFTAVASGNFSSTTTWSGGTAPSTNLTSADNIVISTGLTVTLDNDLTIDNALASINVAGTLSGTHNLNLQNGSITGAGTLSVHNLTYGTASTTLFTGTTTADNLYNSMVTLAISGATQINDTLALYSGTAQLSAVLTLASGAVVNVSGGALSLGTGSFNLTGNVNLLYTGAGTLGTGAELGLSSVNNVTVNLSSTSNQLNMSGDLLVTGKLDIQNGSLRLNGHNLTLNGTFNTTTSGTISGNSASNLTLGGGAGSMGTLNFTSGSNTVNNLTVNGAASGYASLGTDLNVAGKLTLTSGGINLTGSSNLNVTGTDSIVGGSSTSYVATSGTGSLVVYVAGTASLDNSRMIHVGTAAGYAPVRVTNSSATSGNFSANAHAGIFADGTTGTDLSQTQSSVNTSWNVESDITTGANVTLEAFWSTALEVNSFDRANVQLSHYTAGSWDFSTGAQASLHAGGMASISRSGITSFSPFAVFSDRSTGINDVASAEAFTAYPNPALNTITVNVPDTKATSEVKVYDVLGNNVANYSVHTADNKLDITGLTSGVYFMSVNNSHTQKFVKN